MKNPALLLLPALALAACAPAQTQAATPPQSYQASQDQVFNTVLGVIATDGGVPEYSHAFNLAGENMRRIATGPWTIKASDRAGGFIQAEAQSTLVTTFGTDSGQRESHTISAAISGNGDRTQVVVNASERAGYLRDKIFAKLNATYPKLP